MLSLQTVTRLRLPCMKHICCQVQCLSTKAKVKSDLIVDFKKSLPAAQPKKPKRQPFAKNLFLGKVDFEFLAYPEPQHHERYDEFQEWLKPLQDYVNTINPKEFEDTESIPPHVLQKLRELGIFGARIHEDYKGVNLLNSEFMQVLETVSVIPALGLFLLKQGVPAIDIFNKYATVEQKLKYLPNIAAGKSLATVALTEKNSGPMIEVLDTTAVLSDCGNYWIIDGKKTFVPNANIADVFIVIGHALESGFQKRNENLASFIVDLNTEGVSIDKNTVETIGAKGYKTCDVNFKNVKVPKENMIGNIGDGGELVAQLFALTRHYTGALTISLLKNFLNLVSQDILHRKHFDKKYYEIHATQDIIGKINSSIYAMESVLYMTTAMTDIYDNQDVLLETALVEQFCVQECLTTLEKSMWLIGPKVCTLGSPYEQIFRDAFTISNFETSLIDTKIYTGLTGILHYGTNLSETIRKSRNPFKYPVLAFKKVLEKPGHLKLHMEEYLHPSLRDIADFCDRGLFKLKDCTEELLVRHGTEVSHQQVDLSRLSDIASMVYAFLACLSRSSRSYCIGNRDSDSELKICMMLAYKLQQNVFALTDDLKYNEYGNTDYIAKEVAMLNLERKNYFAAHPLKRNY